MTAPGERTGPAPTDERQWFTSGDWIAAPVPSSGSLGPAECESITQCRTAQQATEIVRDHNALAAALSSARAENERHEVFMRAIAECRKDPASAIAQNDIINGKALIRAYDVEQDNDRLRAENAALRESLNVTAERAAGDRRALDEARAKVLAVEAVCDKWEQIAGQGGRDFTGEAFEAFAPTEELRAALAAAQPTESAPR